MKLVNIQEDNKGYIDPTIYDGIVIIQIMRNKAKKLHRGFKTNVWRPRDIDKVLYCFGR